MIVSNIESIEPLKIEVCKGKRGRKPKLKTIENKVESVCENQVKDKTGIIILNFSKSRSTYRTFR